MAVKKILKEVVETNRQRLMKMPGVIGIGAGLSATRPGEKCILVYVKGNQWPAGLPQELEGYPVELQKNKDFRAY